MAEKSNIEWTDATWNPTTGCTKISEGCKNCYADILAKRLQKMHPNGRYRNGFELTLHDDVISLPMKWKKHKRIFVNSMSDLFHKDVPDEFILKVWATMKETPQHTYQILTKRPERMRNFCNSLLDILPNVWLGTSVESAKEKSRIDILRKTFAPVRFVSFEPLIGDVGDLDLCMIKWIIVGGESGKNHRPMRKRWVEDILRQVEWYRNQVGGKFFFFKQWGGLTPKSGGRLLNGKEYSEIPNPRGS